MPTLFQTDFNLTPHTINDGIKQLRDVLKENQVQSKDRIRLAFAAEEFFMKNLDAGNDNQKASLTLSRTWGKYRLLASCEGNPVSAEPPAHAQFNILSLLNLSPDFYRENNSNEMEFEVNARKLSFAALEGCALLLAIFFGALCRSVFTPEQNQLISGFIRPGCDKYTGLLVSCTLIMIFFVIIDSIIKAGGKRMVKQKIKAVFRRALVMNLAAITIGMTLGLTFFRVHGQNQAQTAGIFGYIRDALWNIIPKDPFSPFLEAHSLQILCLAFFIGFTLTAAKAKFDPLCQAVEQLTLFLQNILGRLCLLLPLYIFCYTFCFIIEQTDFQILGKTCTAFGVQALGLTLSALFAIFYYKWVSQTSIRQFLHSTRTSLITALGTASSTAGYQKALDEIKHLPGKQPEYLASTLPLALFFGKSGSALFYTLQIFFAAYLTQTPITLTMLPVMALLLLVITSSDPPVPGGGVTMLPLLLTQFSIPIDFLTILLIIDALVDNLTTVTNFLSINIIARAGLPRNKSKI